MGRSKILSLFNFIGLFVSTVTFTVSFTICVETQSWKHFTQLCRIAWMWQCGWIAWMCLDVWHVLWTLEKLHKKPLRKAVLNLEKMFIESYIIRYIINGFMGAKKYSKKLVPSRKCLRKVRLIRIKILPAVVTAPDPCAVCAKASPRSLPSPQVTEKKIWSFLTVLPVHSFWIIFQMPWMVMLMMYSVFFFRRKIP